MKRKIFSQSIQLFDRARPHYLEYLRNLTPQTLLFAFVLISGSKLNFREFDISNWHATSAFYLLLFAFFLAVYANTTWFYKKSFGRYSVWLRRVQRLVNNKYSNRFVQARAFLAAVWRRRIVESLEVFVVFGLFQIVLAIVVVAGLQAATNMVRQAQ